MWPLFWCTNITPEKVIPYNVALLNGNLARIFDKLKKARQKSPSHREVTCTGDVKGVVFSLKVWEFKVYVIHVCALYTSNIIHNYMIYLNTFSEMHQFVHIVVNSLIDVTLRLHFLHCRCLTGQSARELQKHLQCYDPSSSHRMNHSQNAVHSLYTIEWRQRGRTYRRPGHLRDTHNTRLAPLRSCTKRGSRRGGGGGGPDPPPPHLRCVRGGVLCGYLMGMRGGLKVAFILF